MTTVLIVSNLILWVVVILLLITVFALARQIGVLHERVAPAGALMPLSGPKVGELAPRFELAGLDQKNYVIGGERQDDKAMMIFFISPNCPICLELLPTVLLLARREHSVLNLLFASDGGTVEEHQDYVSSHHIEDYPYLISTELGLGLGVNKLPFAVLIDKNGILRAKGLVNSREQLDSLIEAMELGVASLQEFLQGNEENYKHLKSPA